MPEGSPSVLVIRLDAIGDALALAPSLAALQHTGIPVDVVLRPGNAGIFTPRGVRETIVADFQLRSSTPANRAAIERMGERLRQRRYSHVVVATEDPGGYRLAAATGAPARIGFADPWTKPLKAVWTRALLTQPVYRSAQLRDGAEHECESLFRLFASLVDESRPTRDIDRLRPLIVAREPERSDAVAVQITTKWGRLGMRFDDVVALVRRVSGAGEPDLFCAASEREYGVQVAEATGVPVRFFDELQPWIAAIAGAPAIVVPDSGALHVAGMTGTPVVAVYADDRAYPAQIARWAPWAAPQRLLPGSDGWPQRAVDALFALLSV